MLFEVELIINNAPLTYFNLNTIKTCLTPNHFYLSDGYEILVTKQHL